jgi:hypothetical protein
LKRGGLKEYNKPNLIWSSAMILIFHYEYVSATQSKKVFDSQPLTFQGIKFDKNITYLGIKMYLVSCCASTHSIFGRASFGQKQDKHQC